jgi:dipeptidyl aminopeptidase/acylaminoacyl peptidase
MAIPVSGDEIAAGIGGTNVPPLSAAENGTIVYRSANQAGRRQFTWVSRSGTVLGTIGDIDAANLSNPAVSRDGDRIAFSRTVDNNTDVWMLDAKRGSLSRFTTDESFDQNPVWSPDGTTIVFTSVRRPGYDLYYRRADGGGSETLLTSSPPRAKNATDWSADGQLVLFRHLSFTTGFDVWAVPMQGQHTPFPVVQGVADERDAQFSPDGKWIAYESNQSGRSEIYVQPFPNGRTYGPLSSRGGTQVRWRSDAKELFYIAPDSRLMSVPIQLDSSRNTLEAQAAVPLFVARVGSQASRHQYLVDRTGERFLLNLLLDEEGGYPIRMILNWNGVPTVED